MTKKSNLIIKDMMVSDLVPYINNSRIHDADQIQQVANSIKEFGFTNPILVDEKNNIIAGHGRLRAAIKLEMDSVPTITIKGLTEEQRKAYVIADNKLALNSDWNLDLLMDEIYDLRESGFDETLLGFSFEDLDELFDVKGEDIKPLQEFKEFDDEIATDYKCPSCGYEWSGKTK